MRAKRASVLWIGVLATMPACDAGPPQGAGGPSPVESGVPTARHLTPALGTRTGFMRNAGQVENADVRLYATTAGMDVGFSPAAVLFNIHAATDSPQRGVLARVSFVGARAVVPRGKDEQPGRHHFLRGNDPSKWRRDVRSVARVVYEDLYPGIDLVYRTAPSGVKYEFLLDPGVEPETIRWTYDGIEGVRVDQDGGLVVATAVGELHDEAPVANQEGAELSCAVVLVDFRTASFRCLGRDPALPLVIDPLVYSTFLGGSRGGGGAFDSRVDAEGNVYVSGRVRDAVPRFPTTPGAYDVAPGGTIDAFVTKLGPAGDSLVFSTLLGGAVDTVEGVAQPEEGATGIGFDPAGNILVAGGTTAPDFPVTSGSYDDVFSPFAEHFLVKLSADGSALLWGTFLGGPESNVSSSMAVDAEGSAYVTGGHVNLDRPLPATPGAFDEVPDPDSPDAYVMKVTPDGASVSYATYLGGAREEFVSDIAVDAAGSAYVVGQTRSLEDTFPVTPGAFDTVNSGQFGVDEFTQDAFVVKLSPAGDAVVWGTFLGGWEGENAGGVALDAEGNVYVTGVTESAGFPVTHGAMDTTFDGDSDSFVAKLAPGGNELIYATFVGGSVHPVPSGRGEDGLRRPFVDALGNLYAAGQTTSLDFPTTPGAFDSTHSLGSDPFSHEDAVIVKIDATGSTLLYGTYLGGSDSDSARIAGLGPGGVVYVVGNTKSPDFPTTPGAFDRVFREEQDVFIAKFVLGGAASAPPDCAGAAAAPAVLWPPNHGLVGVSVAGVEGAIAVTGVRQDEPTDERGDGRSCPDAVTPGDGTVELRAERAGSGDGRVYHVDFTAAGVGGECSGTVAVCVPHDQGDPTCGDMGPAFDSLVCGP